MKKIILFVLLLAATTLHGQVFLHYNLEEIKEKITVTSLGVDHEGDVYATAKTHLAEYTYYFDNNGIVVMVFILPLEEVNLVYFVRDYNEQFYSITKNKRWIVDIDGDVADIEVLYSDKIERWYIRWISVDHAL